MKKNTFKHILLTSLSLFAMHIECFSQYENVAEFELSACSGVSLMPTMNTKAMRVSAYKGGEINVDYSLCDNLPDSLKTAIAIATDVWRGYMRNGVLDIKMKYENLSGQDIKITIPYKSIPAPQIGYLYYPPSLYGLLFSEQDSAKSYVEITINKATNWHIGVGSTLQQNEKNLTMAMLQSIARSFGFGTSLIVDSRNNIVYYTQNGKSIFDTKVFSSDGTRLEDLNKETTSNHSLRHFAQQANGTVFAVRNDVNFKLYAPPNYDAAKSLKYFDNENSIMHYNINADRDLLIDSYTIEILDSIGWKSSINNSTVTIVGQDMPPTGITSAYVPHDFYLGDSTNVTNYHWTYKLPLQEGGYDTVCTSTSAIFSVPSITNECDYKHTIEGDIKGVVEFYGYKNGILVSSQYNLTLELKPQILSANVLYKTPCAYDDTYYDAMVEVYYAGAHSIHINVEEEYNSLVLTYYSTKPYYTKILLPNIDSWGYANINFVASNEYGSGTYTLHQESSLNTQSIYSTVSDITNSRNNNPYPIKVDLYNFQGILKYKNLSIEEYHAMKSISGIAVFKDSNNIIISSFGS